MIGDEVQKLSVIQNIPELIKEDYEGCLSKIIPKMSQGLVQGSIEYHLAASKSVQKILKQNIVQPIHFKTNFLKTVIKSIDSRDPDTAKTWLETLLEAIKILKEDVIIAEILPVAVAKSHHTETVFHRVMSCRILGRIAEYTSTYTVQKSVLGVVQALCQDVDKTVRAAMSLQLSQLVRPLTASYERDVLPLLNDSVNDEQAEVRAAAYSALVQSLALVNTEILRQSFLPMAKKIVEQCIQSVQDGIFMIGLTEQYGNLCLGLEPVMNESNKVWFAEAYLKIADQASSVQMKFKERVMDRSRLHTPQSHFHHNSSLFVESRVNCALSMPAMINFCRGLGNTTVGYFTRNIYPLMCMLCSDTQYTVRRAIASVMHEITAALGKSNGFILKEFIKLLNDDSEDVLQSLIPNIKKCLESFCETENFSPEVVDDKSIELTRSLFACEAEVLATYNWRLQAEFFRQIQVLMRCLPSSFIYSQIVQLLRKRLFSYRTVECRVAIVQTLLVFLRFNTNMNQRNDIRNIIITELCCSKNFYNRTIYVRTVPYILELFSSAYFRAHFFIPTIDLMDDKVANIRFMVCDLMPMLKCVAAHDKTNGKFLSMCDTAIEKTSKERDRLVLEHIASMKKIIDKIKFDEKSDVIKIKEEKILDTIAANSKDVKSQFGNFNPRTVPLRTPPIAYDSSRDVKSTNNRSSDHRHDSSLQLTVNCSSPAPAGTSSSQLSPDIISYDMFPNFNQVLFNRAAVNDLLPPNINSPDSSQVPKDDAIFKFPNFSQVTSDVTTVNDTTPNLIYHFNPISSNEPVNGSSNSNRTTRNVSSPPPNARCMSPDIIRNSKSSPRGNLPDIAMNYASKFPDSHVGSMSLEETHPNYDYNDANPLENSSSECLEETSGHRHKNVNPSNTYIVEKSLHKFVEGTFKQNGETYNPNLTCKVENSSSNCLGEYFPQKTYDSKKCSRGNQKTRYCYVESSSPNCLEVLGQNPVTCNTNAYILDNPSSVFIEDTYSQQTCGRSHFIKDNNVLPSGRTMYADSDFRLHNSLNENFQSNVSYGDLNANENLITSSVSECLKINSPNSINNNFETFTPATFTYSYLNVNDTSSENLEMNASNLQNSNLGTSASLLTNRNLNGSERPDSPNNSQGFEGILETRPAFESKILANETSSNITNIEYNREIVENNSYEVKVAEAVTLERCRTIFSEASETQVLCSSPSQLFKNSVTVLEIESNATVSAIIPTETDMSEFENNETSVSDQNELENNEISVTDKNYAKYKSTPDSENCLQSSKEDHPSVSKLLRFETISNKKTETTTVTTGTSIIVDTVNNSEIEIIEPISINKLGSIVSSESETNLIKQHSQIDKSLFKKDEQPKMTDSASFNKSPKLSKNISSGIPTINKSPRRSLVLEGGCTSDFASSTPMNTRRSLVFDNGSSSDISSVNKSQKGSLSLANLGANDYSTTNKSPRRSLVYGNDVDPDFNAKSISKPESSPNRRSKISNSKLSLGFKKAEPRKPCEGSVVQSEKVSDETVLNIDTSRNPSQSLTKISNEGFQKGELGKPSESPGFKRSYGKTSEGFQKAEEPGKQSQSQVAKRSTDRLSEKYSQKAEERRVTKRSSIQAPQKSFLPIRAPKNVENCDVSCDETLVTTNSKRHSLGTLSADNAVVINKQLSRRSTGRPQSLVINSSRLPVRNAPSPNSSGSWRGNPR